jgi:hypothetical protein
MDSDYDEVLFCHLYVAQPLRIVSLYALCRVRENRSCPWYRLIPSWMWRMTGTTLRSSRIKICHTTNPTPL